MKHEDWFYVSGQAADTGDISAEAYFPDEFYDGVLYGLSAWDPEGRQSDPAANDAANKELLRELRGMWPQPAAIYNRTASSAAHGWGEAGYAVRFLKPSVEAERGILFLARSFGQVCCGGTLALSRQWLCFVI